MTDFGLEAQRAFLAKQNLTSARRQIIDKHVQGKSKATLSYAEDRIVDDARDIATVGWSVSTSRGFTDEGNTIEEFIDYFEVYNGEIKSITFRSGSWSKDSMSISMDHTGEPVSINISASRPISENMFRRIDDESSNMRRWWSHIRFPVEFFTSIAGYLVAWMLIFAAAVYINTKLGYTYTDVGLGLLTAFASVSALVPFFIYSRLFPNLEINIGAYKARTQIRQRLRMSLLTVPFFAVAAPIFVEVIK